MGSRAGHGDPHRDSRLNLALLILPLYLFVQASQTRRAPATQALVGEARRAGMIGQEEAASLTDIPNIAKRGPDCGTG